MIATTRRRALHRFFVLGAAVAASAPRLVRPGRAAARTVPREQILESAIELEQTAVVVYRDLATSGVVDPPVAHLLASIAREEQRDADLLIALLRQSGGTPPQPPAPGDVDGLDGARTTARALEFAVELEQRAIAAYEDAATETQDSEVLRALAGLVAAHAANLAALRLALGRAPAPRAFERGSHGP